MCGKRFKEKAMFYYLEGTVAELLPYLAVIDCGGVGYACKTTNNTLSHLKKGQKGKVYTYLNVGEGVFDLYGFATQSELHTFRMLLGVSGVGPKAALAILSTGTPDALAMAIITGDEKTLTAAPGIGKKIAQRIILELKDKLAKESAATGLDFSSNGTSVNAVSFTNKASEAAQALAVLGYSSAEVAVALKGVDVENLPLEEIIRQSLKKMVK
jgi:Holliday junction DNA helicase RuvA